MFMPCLQNERVMRLDDPPNHVQFPGAKPMTSRQLDRIKLELTGPVLTFDVHVGWLAAVETCEEESVWTGYARDARHSDGSLQG
jgi:hypothetical protein